MIPRILLSLVIVLCLSTAGFAQKGLHIGISTAHSATFTINTPNWGDLYQFHKKAHYRPSIALLTAYQFNESVGIQVEAGIGGLVETYEKACTTTICPDVPLYKELKVNYVQIPLLFRYTTPSAKRTRFYLLVGPQVDILIRADEASATSVVPPTFTGGNIKDQVRQTGVSIAFEPGVNVHMGKNWHFNAGLRSYFALTDLDNESTTYLSNGTEGEEIFEGSRMASIGINVGVKYVFLSNK